MDPKKAYSDSYSTPQLKKWSSQILNWVQQEFVVFCYFDNDEKGYAIRDAIRLKKLTKIKGDF